MSAQLSDLRFTSNATESRSRQLALSIARPWKHQTVRLSLRDIRLLSTAATHQRSLEIEDTVHSKHLTLGGAARLQRSAATTTVFARASLQAHLGRWTGFLQFENGNDLVNRSIFATTNFRTMVAGITARVWRGWDLQFEAFRNRLDHGPEPRDGVLTASPGHPRTAASCRVQPEQRIPAACEALRVGRARRGRPPLGNPHTTTGQLQGTVHSLGLGDTQPAASIPVLLDGSRSTFTNDSGLFLFTDIPVGPHTIALDVRNLPADFDPAWDFERTIRIDPGRRAEGTTPRLAPRSAPRHDHQR